MISKFEAIGIFTSIAAMAIALFLLRIDTVAESVAVIDGETQQAGVVVVDEAGGAQARHTALAEALSDEPDGDRLVIDDVKIGGGVEATSGDTVRVNYIGRLTNGQEFDNSYKRGAPFEFTLGEGRVIAGWEQGIVGMKVGGERILVIPPQLAYGTDAVGPIPANSTLIFAVELLEVQSANE